MYYKGECLMPATYCTYCWSEYFKLQLISLKALPIERLSTNFCLFECPPVSVITFSGHYKCSEVLYLLLVSCQI